MRILLVDDDKAFRATVRDLLTRRAGAVHVEEAADGDAALRMIMSRRPDVVLMDLTMPRVSGIEATRRLKARWPDLPVVVLTVHDEPIYERTARAAGADAFVLKKMAGTGLWSVVSRLAGSATRAADHPGAQAADGSTGATGKPHREDSAFPLGYPPDWLPRLRPLENR
jgi:DNA-binding NarL/FixJ family response regulator